MRISAWVTDALEKEGKKGTKNASGVQERNIYAGYAETLMQAHSDSRNNSCLPGLRITRPTSKLTGSYAFTAGVTCMDASVACSANRWKYAYRTSMGGKNRNALLIDKTPVGGRWCTFTPSFANLPNDVLAKRRCRYFQELLVAVFILIYCNSWDKICTIYSCIFYSMLYSILCVFIYRRTFTFIKIKSKSFLLEANNFRG